MPDSESGNSSRLGSFTQWWGAQSTVLKLLLVIGVLFVGFVFLVVFTIIAAAILGVFVLGFGDSAIATTPIAEFDYEYSAEERSVTVTHLGGDDIDPDYLSIQSSGETVQWTGNGDPVSAGDWTTIDGIDPGDTVRVVWTSPETGETTVIHTYNAPT